jgi:small subunit ribosomal protein S21
MGVSLVKVVVRDGNIQKALQVYKKKVERSGHIEELKRRREYNKPSVIKHKLDQDIKFKRRREKENKKTPTK